jgi:multimeric flavodoxin WrbA
MILGLCGSPRKKATEYILKKALNLLDEKGYKTKFFTVRGKEIGFCKHCDYCIVNKKCTLKDDVFELYPLIEKARGIIIATPVYNGGISAQIKAIMDRCRALLARNPKAFQHKVGMAIAVGGDRMGGQELAIQEIITFYIINGAIPVGGGFFGANLGATFWSKDTLEFVMKDEEGLKTLRKTINKFTKFLEKYEDKKSLNR